MLVHAIGVGRARDLFIGGNQAHDELFAQTPRGVGADLIGETARRDGDEPAARIVGESLFRPLFRRRDQRFLDGVFAAAEVAIAAEERAQDARREIAQEILGASAQPIDHWNSGGGPLITCRTSIGMLSGLPPGPGAADAAAAIAYARSGVSTSTIQ